MNLIKTTLFNGIAVLVKIIGALIVNKILAIYVGPSGYANIGQFQNMISVLNSLCGGFLSNGVIKLTAENNNQLKNQHNIWSASLKLSLIFSLVLSIILVFYSNEISNFIFRSSDFSNILICIPIFLFSSSINNILISIINGKKEIKIFVILNIINSILTVMCISLLTVNYGFNGAIISLFLAPVGFIIFTIFFINNFNWFNYSFLLNKLDKNSVTSLFGFVFMGLTSAVVVPITLMIIRSYIENHLGLENAGYWQAIWKISDIYLLVVTGTLSAYYLPRIAEIKNSREMRFEVNRIFKFSMPIVIIGALFIYCFRIYIIDILFTQDFYPMAELFLWQFIGDIIKIASWIFGYILIGKALVKYYIVTEILFSITFIIISYFMINAFGLIGVTVAYMINYLLHFLCMYWIYTNELDKWKKNELSFN